MESATTTEGHIPHLPDYGRCGNNSREAMVGGCKEVLDASMDFEEEGMDCGEITDVARVVDNFRSLQETLSRRAADDWCRPLTDGARDGRLCVHAEISDRQMRAMFTLWAAWCEEEGTTLNTLSFTSHIIDRVMVGAFMPIVMYDGDVPVGVCDATFFADPMTGEHVCFGDHAYVLPEYRKGSVMRRLFEAFLSVVQLGGATAAFGPVDVNKAKFLQNLYEQYGGYQVATLMTWRP